jgi:hypothetical protein
METGANAGGGPGGSRQRLGSLVLLSALVAGQLGCSEAAAEREARLSRLEQERHSLLLRFSSAQMGIRQSQAAALDAEGVRAVQQEFYGVLRRRIIEMDPGAEELLERAAAVGSDLAALSAPVLRVAGDSTDTALSDEESWRVAGELRELEVALRPILDRAFTDSAVASSFKELQDSLVAAIIKIDPGAEATIARMREIEAQIGQLDRQIAELRP